MNHQSVLQARPQAVPTTNGLFCPLPWRSCMRLARCPFATIQLTSSWAIIHFWRSISTASLEPFLLAFASSSRRSAPGGAIGAIYILERTIIYDLRASNQPRRTHDTSRQGIQHDGRRWAWRLPIILRLSQKRVFREEMRKEHRRCEICVSLL